MGYRSEVCVCVKDISVFNPEDISDAEVIESKSSTVLHWDWVKWYSDYEYVQRIETAMRTLPDFHFIRIGEDTADVEEESAGCGLDFGIRIERRIGGI